MLAKRGGITVTTHLRTMPLLSMIPCDESEVRCEQAHWIYTETVLIQLPATIHQESLLPDCDVVEIAGLCHDVQAWYEPGHEVHSASSPQSLHFADTII